MRYKQLIVLLFCLLCCGVIVAQDQEAVEDTAATLAPPAPVANLRAVDRENDHGHGIIVHWDLSPDDMTLPDGAGSVISYDVYRWVPDFKTRLATLSRKFSMVRAGVPTSQIYIDDARAALSMVQEGQVDLEALPYKPAVPELTADTAAWLALVEKALQDSISAMDGSFVYSKDSVRTFRRTFLDSVDYLATAYGQYPNNGSWVKLGVSPAGETSFDDIGAKEKESGDFMPDFTGYYYRVDAVTGDPAVVGQSEVFGPVESKGQWFNTGRIPVLFAVLVFGALTLIFVLRAKKGADLYVRPLGGIEAVDEAIGRATEMGKPILYVLGLGTAADVATIASFTILGRVAKRVAEYQTQLIVPTYDPIVMTVAQEVVKSAYMDAGRPETYKEDTVFFVTQAQFAYVAAVNGIMMRELPATNVYMGKFFAESLLLAETGAMAGSIQISGTDEIAQIPFFIVACDYTLIGEELYAASAYLGREPILLGSLKAQDWAKAAIILFAIAGIIAAQLDWTAFTELFRVAN